MDANQISTELKKFLKSENTSSVANIDSYVITKMNFGDDFVLLYRVGYGKTLDFNLNEKPECIGFYNKNKDIFYAFGLFPLSTVDDGFVVKFYSVRDEFINTIKTKFNEWVNSISKENAFNTFNSFPMDSYETNDYKYFLEHTIVSDARKAILDGFTSKTYEHKFNFIDDEDIKLNAKQSCMLTNDFDDLVNDFLSYFKGNLFKTVYKSVNNKYKVIEQIDKFETEHIDDNIFKLRDMRKNINPDTMQMVRLTICKNGKTFSFKYPVQSLYYQFDSRWLSEYSIPAQERQEYKNLFGREDLKPLDIVKIEYGKQVLYQAN